jgi:hypothetical protein
MTFILRPSFWVNKTPENLITVDEPLKKDLPSFECNSELPGFRENW